MTPPIELEAAPIMSAFTAHSQEQASAKRSLPGNDEPRPKKQRVTLRVGPKMAAHNGGNSIQEHFRTVWLVWPKPK